MHFERFLKVMSKRARGRIQIKIHTSPPQTLSNYYLSAIACRIIMLLDTLTDFISQLKLITRLRGVISRADRRGSSVCVISLSLSYKLSTSGSTHTHTSSNAYDTSLPFARARATEKELVHWVGDEMGKSFPQQWPCTS